MSERKFRIPYIKETRRLIDQYTYFIWSQLIAGKIFSPANLRGLVFNYPNTLLLGIQEKLHQALEKEKVLKTKPRLSDYIGETSYLLSRLVDREDIAMIFSEILSGKKVHVHLVEKIIDTDGLNIKRPSARGRRYVLEQDDNGEKHLIFEVRRQTINNEKNPPTDFLELMSFFGFYEMTRYLVRLSIEKPYLLPKATRQRKKLLSLINSYFYDGEKWDFEKLKAWAESSGGFFLEPYENQRFFSLFSLEKTRDIKDTAIFADAEKIKNKIEEKGLSIPESIVLGNEFIFPLIIALPLLTDEDLNVLRSSIEANKDGKPLDLLPKSIRKERLKKSERELIERFMYLQFLSKYKGNDSVLNNIKKRIFSKIEEIGVKKRLFSAEEVSLGDPVDYYDLSKLNNEYYIHLLKKFPNKILRDILFRLINEGKCFLNFSYPLGDNTYGLIESLKEVMPEINNIVFFGKVGATLSWDGQKNLGARVGRVVIPEYVSSINDFNPQKFIDRLKEYNIKLPIISDRDNIEEIFQSEGVLLQTLMDIKKAQEAIIIREDIPYYDKIKLLIDMESWYLNLICQRLGIIPSVVYYTSDNTKLPPIAKENIETIISSLGPRGSFAILVTGLIALNSL